MISNSPARLNNLGLELLESIQHEFEPEYYCSSLTGVLCLRCAASASYINCKEFRLFIINLVCTPN